MRLQTATVPEEIRLIKVCVPSRMEDLCTCSVGHRGDDRLDHVTGPSNRAPGDKVLVCFICLFFFSKNILIRLLITAIVFLSLRPVSSTRVLCWCLVWSPYIQSTHLLLPGCYRLCSRSYLGICAPSATTQPVSPSDVLEWKVKMRVQISVDLLFIQIVNCEKMRRF